MYSLVHAHLLQFLSYDPDTGRFTWKVNRSNVLAGDIAGYSNGRYWHTFPFLGDGQEISGQNGCMARDCYWRSYRKKGVRV